MQTWQSSSPDRTMALGEALGRSLSPGITIGLIGPLGAGKTHFVKGIAVGNGLDDPRIVTSPTFSLVQEYPGKFTLTHIDAYRLVSARELDELGFDEMVSSGGAVVVEWADRVESVIPPDAMWVTFQVAGESSRELSFRATGPQSADCLQAMSVFQ